MLRINRIDQETGLPKGESTSLVRDVTHVHPQWVHEQLETASESELQRFLDNCDLLEFAANAPNDDDAGVYMTVEDAHAWVAERVVTAESFHDIEQYGCRVGDWEEVASYLGRYYGEDGSELGAIPISVAPIYFSQDQDDVIVAWCVAETPDETTEFHGVYSTQEDAEQRAKELAEELDETPDLDAIIAQIEDTGFFRDPDIIPSLIRALTQYSQGYILVVPEITEPVGTMWATNGYLQRDDYVSVDATHDTQVEAAEALLSAIRDLHSK